MDKLTKYNLGVFKLLIAGFLTACVLAIVGVVVLVGALCWEDLSRPRKVAEYYQRQRERIASDPFAKYGGYEITPPPAAPSR